MTPREIAQRLADRVDDVCRELLPNGKRDGHEWRVGSTDGEAGKSTAVHLSGSKAGVWSDFQTGQAGDLLDLWVAVRKLPLREAMTEAASFLGIRDIGESTFADRKPRQYRRPKRPECTVPKGEPLDYLKRRGLSEKTLAAYKIGTKASEIVFPFVRDGELIMAKVREAVDGAKPKPTEAECEKCLFGWQVIRDNARNLLITEGEIDAMSAFELGVPACSVPYGGGGGNKQDWIENDFDHLQRFDEIYLAMDRDDAGKQAVEEIVKRLGADRVRIVDIPAPHKDVNDLLRAGWDTGQFMGLIRRARTMDPSELKPASNYVDEVIAEFYPADEQERGFGLPWRKADGVFLFRPGEVVILAGINGHGKTECAGMTVIGAIEQQRRCCVASLEFQPRKWLRRVTRQAAGVDSPTVEYIRTIMDWYQDRLWVFDVTGTARIARMLEVFRYAVRRYRVQFFVIDNLAKCGIAEDDYPGQKDFVDVLTDFAKEYDVTVLLVAHMAKADEATPGRKKGIKGSGGMADMADTVMTIWRNKPKEERAKRGKPGPDDGDQPDAMLYVEKQRNGEEEPHFSLWFHKISHQYIEFSSQSPRKFVKFGQAPSRQVQ